jgi:hypothetical protein
MPDEWGRGVALELPGAHKRAREDARRDMLVQQEEERSEERLKTTLELRKKLSEVADVLDRLEGLGWVSRKDAIRAIKPYERRALEAEKAADAAVKAADAAVKEEKARHQETLLKWQQTETVITELRTRLKSLAEMRHLAKEELEKKLVKTERALARAELRLVTNEGPRMAGSPPSDEKPLVGALDLRKKSSRAVCEVCPDYATHYLKLPVELLYLCETHVVHEVEKYRMRVDAATARTMSV